MWNVNLTHKKNPLYDMEWKRRIRYLYTYSYTSYLVHNKGTCCYISLNRKNKNEKKYFTKNFLMNKLERQALTKNILM